MFKYFVRYQYSYYPSRHNYYNEEYRGPVEETDSQIITSVFEFTDMDQVRDKLKEVTQINEYFDIIAMNRL
jgi:hypothetical protein